MSTNTHLNSAVAFAAPIVVPPTTLRVLQVVNGQYYAGAGRVQDLLAMHLPEFNCESDFVCVKPDVFPAKRQSQRSKLHEIPLPHPWSKPAIAQIADVVNNGDYDVIHCHTPRSSWAALSAGQLTGRPVVHTMHDVFFSLGGNITKRLQNRYSIARLRDADFVTTVSPESMRLAEELDLGKTRRMIANGVPKASPPIERTRPAKEWTLGIVGLIRPCKGIEILIRGVGELRDRGCDVKLVVVGTFYENEYEHEINELVSSLDAERLIEFVGFTSDVPAQLRRLDLFVMPSVGPEGLPMVLLEAMAHGLPAIGSDVPGISDTIRHGRDGLIFPNRDHAKLADAVESFIDGRADYLQMSRTVQARHAAEFSASRMAGEFADVYREVSRG
ncbi:glycosyltransferase [Planctomycetes bacterium K23_9]|uniref:Glycosyltransferase EpsD n=1 Tax=Stieleria marina TaxID=1930275 RepID=A0A517NR35_9BACT|nr:Putative glycosyltransferase EpsD [Planctomycetes bacterium K23_9]